MSEKFSTAVSTSTVALFPAVLVVKLLPEKLGEKDKGRNGSSIIRTLIYCFHFLIFMSRQIFRFTKQNLKDLQIKGKRYSGIYDSCKVVYYPLTSSQKSTG